MATAIEQVLKAARSVRDDAQNDARNATDHAERSASYAVASAFDRFIDCLAYAERQAAEEVLARTATV